MKTLEHSKKVWEGLARSDPYWTVCTDPKKRGGRWDAAELLATGDLEVNTVISLVETLGLAIKSDGRALDFGCGVGRLTQALSRWFAECYGIDISPEMISAAKELARDNPRCHFFVNDVANLSQFQSNSFTFVYSSIVLQHIPREYVTSYLRDFVRILKPGGILVFQIPDRRKGEWIKRTREILRVRTRLRYFAALAGIPQDPPRSGWKMYCYSEQRIRRLFSSEPCKIADVSITNSCAPDFNGNLKLIQQAPIVGFVSKQYVIAKSAIGDKTE